MTLDIPYTFIPGDKAKANQVNENFLAVKQSFDSNEDLLEQAQADILNLDNNKADIDGDPSQAFYVEDATENKEAVNLQTYKRLSANTIDYIQGYQLAKFDDTSVTAAPGSCYDSNRETIITSDSTLTASQSNLSANTTYYIYVTYDDDTLALVIDLSNSAPSGYDVYRQLGYVKTDGSSHINLIFSYGADSSSPNPKATIQETYRNGYSWYRVWSDGWIEQGGWTNGGESNNRTVYLLKPYQTYEYTALVTCRSTGSTDNGWGYAHNFNLDWFRVVQSASGAIWMTCGY